jgi:hypothetical protein
MSDFLAFGALVGAIAIIPLVNLIPNVLKTFGLILLVFGAVTFSKIPSIWVVVLIFSLRSLFETRSWMRTAIPILVGVFYIVLFRLISLPGGSYRIAFLDPYSVGEHAVGGLASRVLAIIYVLMPYGLGFTALALVISRHRKNRDVLSVAFAFILIMLTGVFILILVGGYDSRAMSYLSRPAGVVFGLSVVTCLYADQSNFRTHRRIFAAVITGFIIFLLWLIVIPGVIPNLNAGSGYAKMLRIVRDPQFVGILALAGFSLGILWRFAATKQVLQSWNPTFIRKSFSSLILVAGAISVGLILIVTRFEERLADTRSGYESSLNARVLGTASQREVAEKLTALSTYSSVIAYSGDCLDPVLENCFRPLLFAAYSRRQFLFCVSFQKAWGFANDREKQEPR